LIVTSSPSCSSKSPQLWLLSDLYRSVIQWKGIRCPHSTFRMTRRQFVLAHRSGLHLRSLSRK
jgi:hypothetical protein